MFIAYNVSSYGWKINMYRIDHDDYLQLANQLNLYHSVFYKFWLLGKPVFTDKINTAAVAFDKEGHCINFMVNENFWKSQTMTQKAFIICHECQHIIREHGLRSSNLKETDKDIANIAMDLTINHNLVKYYNFNRSEIDPKSEYCWIDTVFKDCSNILEGESFEYYYNKLKEHGNNGMLMPANFVDSHDYFDTFSEQEMNHIIYDELTEEEIEDVEKMASPGSRGSGGFSGITMDREKVVVKKKWESVIKKWAQKKLSDNQKEESQWIKPHRRHALLDPSLLLPSDMEIDERDMDVHKIDVFFFLDTSGSCRSLAPRFWRATNSLPKDRFNLRLYCFSDGVHPVSLEERKLYGFGGTDFEPISREVTRAVIKDKIKDYAVFVLTDGWGSPVYPVHPEKWYWFLTENYTKYIPPRSHIHKLSEYE